MKMTKNIRDIFVSLCLFLVILMQKHSSPVDKL